jgi:Ca-activated chloride channel family protein
VAEEVAVTFRLPWVLWFLVAVPMLSALLVYGYRARKRSLTTFGLESTLGPLLIGKTPRVRAVRGVLAVLGVTFAVLAWAGPQYGSHTRVMKKRGIDVVLALDFSKSMLARDVRPSRIERAKAELTRFLGDLTGDRVGVVAFAGDTMEFPMTTDYAAVELFLRDLGPYDMPVGGTAIGRALTASARLLERASRPKDENEAEGAEPERSRVVILLTDGEDHEGEPVEAAKQLAATGARVFVVGIGSATGEPIPTFAPDGTWTGYLRDEKGSPVLSALTAANEKQLAEIASVGNGTYFRAKQGAVGVDEIRKLMKGMKQAESKARRVSIAEDRYLLALLPAFLLLLIEGVLPDGLTRKRKRKGRAAAALAAMLPFLALCTSSNRALAWEPFRSKSSDVERGNELLQKGDADAALEAYDTARKKLPNEPGVDVNRGLALAASGKLDEAREAFQAVAHGKASKELRAAANYNLGLSFIKQAEAAGKADDLDKAQGFLRESIDALKASLRDGPGNRDAAWNLELARRQLVDVEKKREEKKKQQEQDKQDQEKNDPQDDNQNQDGQQGDEPKQDDGQQNDEPKDEGKDGQPKDGESPEQPEAKGEEKPEDSAKQPEQDDKKPEPQKGPPSPEQTAPEPGKDGAPSEAQPQKVLPEHMQKALDALSEGEQSLEKYRARQRATQRPRRIEKDW